jgi:hypothetical protein
VAIKSIHAELGTKKLGTMTCEGCERDGATTELWYPAPSGCRPVALHENRACAEMARERLGGRRFLPTRDADLLVVVREYADELRARFRTGVQV